MVLLEIIARRLLPEIDLDLLNARIALDIDEPANGPQVVVQFVAAANIQRGIARPIKIAQARQS